LEFGALLGLEKADHATRSSLFMTDRWQQVEKLCQSALELGRPSEGLLLKLALGAVSLG
jgi:hypothetical protein